MLSANLKPARDVHLCFHEQNAYIVSKLFTYLFLPPVFLRFFHGAAFFVKRFRLFSFANGIILYFLSTPYVADWLLTPLEAPYNTSVEKRAVDAVIVLGGGHTQGAQPTRLAATLINV